jgi:hypothetical protein
MKHGHVKGTKKECKSSSDWYRKIEEENIRKIEEQKMSEICDFCQKPNATLQVMYPTFDSEQPNLLFPCCTQCAKSAYVVVPTAEEMLKIRLGEEVTNEKIEALLKEEQEVVQEFITKMSNLGIELREETDSPM